MAIKLAGQSLEAAGLSIGAGKLDITGEARAGELGFDTGVGSFYYRQLDVNGLEVVGGGLTVSASRFCAAEVTHDRRQICLEAVSLADVSVRVDLPAPKDSQTGASGSSPGLALTSFDFLDAFDGRLDVDVELDYTAAVVGRRRAIHQFRLPIVGGTLDYRLFESGLAHLENSVIDFELEPGRLIIEKDLPLVPFDNTTLIVWPLSERDQKLAEDGLLRLATIPRFQVPAKKAAGPAGKKRSFELNSIYVHDLSARLDAATRMVVQLGAGTIECAVRELAITGEIAFRREDHDEPSLLRATATELGVSSAELRLGSKVVRNAELQLAGIEEIRVHFDGFRPTALELRAKSLAIPRAVIELGA